MNKPTIYFRADGNSKIGLGHVIRSCALADILRDSFNCTFFIRQPSGYLEEEIGKAGATLVQMPVYDSYEEEAITWVASLNGSEIIVLDGYHFDSNYQKQIKLSNCKLVSIDDIHTYPFVSDIVINHTGGTQVNDYSAECYTQYFLGLKYALLRKAFLAGRTKKAEDRVLLICLGGADPQNDTLKVWKKVVDAGFKAIHILVGSAYRFEIDLNAATRESNVQTFIHQSLSAEAVALLMQDCSHAVLSPSGVVLEYMAFKGVVYLHQIADNQTHLKTFIINNGLARDFKQFGLLSESEELEMIRKQQQVFDNKSPERLLQVFNNLAMIADVKIERVSTEDLQMTFSWANDSASRKMSYNNNPILLEEHSSWFLSRINNPACFYYILKFRSEAFAQIRFEKKEDQYILSYFIDQSYRGKGLASFILSEGIRKLQEDLDNKPGKVVGYVKKENISSCLSFEKMNFLKEDTTHYINSYKYTLQF